MSDGGLPLVRRRQRREGREKEMREFDGRDYVLERAITRRLRDREGVEGRPLRQPRLPARPR